MMFFGVFLRETARTADHSRTNLSTNSEKLPNSWTDWHQIWHTFADSCGNGYRSTPNKLPLETQGGFRGSSIQKSWEAVKRLDQLAPHLAHMWRFIWEWIYAKQIAPRDAGRGHLAFLCGQTFKVLGSYQTAGSIGTNFGSRLRIHLGMDTG